MRSKSNINIICICLFLVFAVLNIIYVEIKMACGIYDIKEFLFMVNLIIKTFWPWWPW